MTTVNSADKVQGLVLVRTASLWAYVKGSLSIGLKFGGYYFKFPCKRCAYHWRGASLFRGGGGYRWNFMGM